MSLRTAAVALTAYLDSRRHVLDGGADRTITRTIRYDPIIAAAHRGCAARAVLRLERRRAVV